MARITPVIARDDAMTVPRRLLLLFTCMAVGSAASFAPAEPVETAQRPNILWLIAEDMGVELGCYGASEVETPHLDALARSGVRYTRFYTTAPVCSASRSAFMTGMYQTSINAHNHRSHRDDGYTLPAGVRLLTAWLADAGYYNVNLRVLPESCGFRGVGKTDWNFSVAGPAFDSDRWEDLASHQPFFAQLNFTETHRPFRAPRRADPARVQLPPYYPDHPVARADWAAYLDSVMELDRKVGLVLEALRASGLDRNTVVVFFADNGMAHVRGKQFCYEEGLHVPLIMRWPEGLAPPEDFVPGSVDDRLLAAIDLAPTMLYLAGAARPPGMQGRTFLGPQRDPPRQYLFAARDRCDETVFRLRTVRDARYRYIRNFTPDRPFLQANAYKERSYPMWNLIKELHAAGQLTPAQSALAAPTMPEEELYDLETDPHEIHNLAASPEHAAALARLRGALEAWLQEAGDTGAHLEPEDLVRRQGVTKPGTHPNTGYVMEDPRPKP